MTVNFLTAKLTQEQRNNFMAACKNNIHDDCVVTVEPTEADYLMIKFYRAGCDFEYFYFIMSPAEFDFINYANCKLLQAGSQITQLHNTIIQLANKRGGKHERIF